MLETKGGGNNGESKVVGTAGGTAGGTGGGTGGGTAGDNKGVYGGHSLSTISVVQHSTPDTDTNVAVHRAPYDPAEDELLLITLADLCYNTTRGT